MVRFATPTIGPLTRACKNGWTTGGWHCRTTIQRDHPVCIQRPGKDPQEGHHNPTAPKPPPWDWASFGPPTAGRMGQAMWRRSRRPGGFSCCCWEKGQTAPRRVKDAFAAAMGGPSTLGTASARLRAARAGTGLHFRTVELLEFQNRPWEGRLFLLGGFEKGLRNFSAFIVNGGQGQRLLRWAWINALLQSTASTTSYGPSKKKPRGAHQRRLVTRAVLGMEGREECRAAQHRTALKSAGRKINLAFHRRRRGRDHGDRGES